MLCATRPNSRQRPHRHNTLFFIRWICIVFGTSCETSVVSHRIRFVISIKLFGYEHTFSVNRWWWTSNLPLKCDRTSSNRKISIDDKHKHCLLYCSSYFISHFFGSSKVFLFFCFVLFYFSLFFWCSIYIYFFSAIGLLLYIAFAHFAMKMNWWTMNIILSFFLFSFSIVVCSCHQTMDYRQSYVTHAEIHWIHANNSVIKHKIHSKNCRTF